LDERLGGWRQEGVYRMGESFHGLLKFARVGRPIRKEIAMKSIFIGNLDFSTTEDQLRALFAAHGAVETVTLVRDRDTGQPRGFAFLEMTNDSEAEKAIQALNGSALGSGKLTVNEARPKAASDRGSDLRKREHRRNRF